MRNMKNWAETLIAGPGRKAMPILSTPGVALIDASIRDVFLSGELQFQVIRALAERFPGAAALTIMDLSVEAEAFGSPVRFSDEENPTVIGPVIRDADDVLNLKIPEIGTARTRECILAAERCAEEITDRPTLGGMIGPFSLAGRLLDMNSAMLWAATEPETLRQLLEKVTDFLTAYARAFKAAGCGGLIMAEPAAGLISPRMCRQFSAAYVRPIFDAVQDESFVCVLHNCGKTEKQVDAMLSTNAAALHVGNAVDIVEILKQTPENIPVMGNLDPAAVFLAGTPDSVFQATAELLERTKPYPHFVLSSGCDIPPGTPLENIRAFYEAFARYAG